MTQPFTDALEAGRYTRQLEQAAADLAAVWGTDPNTMADALETVLSAEAPSPHLTPLDTCESRNWAAWAALTSPDAAFAILLILLASSMTTAVIALTGTHPALTITAALTLTLAIAWGRLTRP